jgi:hypothetical protein
MTRCSRDDDPTTIVDKCATCGQVFLDAHAKAVHRRTHPAQRVGPARGIRW